MAKPNAFLSAIRGKINGPLDIMMTEAVLSAAIEFCAESLYCRENRTITAVEMGEVYSLIDDPQLRAFKILDVRSPDELLVNGVDYEVLSDNQFRFRRSHESINLICAVKPRHDASEVPDILVDDYKEVIADGALARLFMMVDKPWSQPSMSQFYRAKFVDGYRKAFRDSLERYSTPINPNPVRQHEFY